MFCRYWVGWQARSLVLMSIMRMRTINSVLHFARFSLKNIYAKKSLIYLNSLMCTTFTL